MPGSWLSLPPDTHFPLENLPLGVGSPPGAGLALFMRIGDFALACEPLRLQGFLGQEFSDPLTDLTSLSLQNASKLRGRVRDLLAPGSVELRESPLREHVLLPVEAVRMQLPCRIPAFVDFYSGIHHASNVGRMFRPDMPPLLPNYRHIPVAYNGRASTIVASGEPVLRPSGQFKLPESDIPDFGPTRELDFELELGFLLAAGNGHGAPISVEEAESMMHGLVLVNDWSARDFQRWEYQPLGPFLAKSFRTSISPWVVPLEALEPFRVSGFQEPAPLQHLRRREPALYDLELEVSIQTQRMTRPQTVCVSNAKHLYWSFGQQLAHQTSNGTRVESGDLYATGTISGPDPDSFGSLLEATWRGRDPILLDETGETRTFLEDGDRVTFTAHASNADYTIGFGTLEGQVVG